MPNVPQFPQFTASRITDFQVWVEGYLTAIQRIWTQLVFVVNALSRNDTAANRPSTPELNETFFTETDTNQTYVAVDGAWVSLGSQRDGRAFSFFMS